MVCITFFIKNISVNFTEIFYEYFQYKKYQFSVVLFRAASRQPYQLAHLGQLSWPGLTRGLAQGRFSLGT